MRPCQRRKPLIGYEVTRQPGRKLRLLALTRMGISRKARTTQLFQAVPSRVGGQAKGRMAHSHEGHAGLGIPGRHQQPLDKVFPVSYKIGALLELESQQERIAKSDSGPVRGCWPPQGASLSKRGLS